MIGTTISKYRILERLGRGGMGTVYKAIDETLDRVVAIKVLNPDLADAELMKRFRAEAISLARLNHPGIATIYELHRHDDDLLMVMEFVRGETLQKLSERLGPLEPPQAAHICIQILDALAHAHGAGIIHRDLKPANVMVTDSGAIKVMDFGIARMLGGEHLTHTGYMMGTPAYMAPEQVLGEELDGRADLYSVGVLFYRLLSRELPFKADTAISMAQKQVAEQPTPIATFRPDLPAWCEAIITKALSKARDDRFPTPEAFRAALTAAVTPANLGELPTLATPTASGMIRTGDMTLPRPFPVAPATPSSPQATAANEPTAISGTSPSAAVPNTAATTAPAPERTGMTPMLRRTHLISAGVLLLIVLALGGLWASGLLNRRGSDQPQTATPPPDPSAPAAAAAGAPADQTPSAPAPAAQPVETPPSAAQPEPPAVPPVPTGAATTPAPSASPAATTRKPKPTPKPADPAAVTPPPVVTTPEPAAAPPPPPEKPALPSVTFKDVKVLVRQGKSLHDRDATLTLAGDHLSLSDRSGKTQIISLPYTAIIQAYYSRSKEPKWKGPDGKERTADVDQGNFGFFRGERNWLILTTHGEPVFLRLEDRDLRTALPALQERTQLTIHR